MISGNILNFILEFNSSISTLTQTLSPHTNTETTPEIEKIFFRKTKLMKKVVKALQEDLASLLGSSEPQRLDTGSKIVVNKIESQSPNESHSSLKDPMTETTTSLLRVKTSKDRLRSSRSRSKSRRIKIQKPKPKSAVSSSQKFGSNSQQLELFKTDYHVTDALLDICVVSNNIVYGCGEFGLKEYEITQDGKIKSEVSLIDDQVILDVQKDFRDRLIFTNPDEGGIYMIDDDNIVFVSDYITLMAGLNLRIDRAGKNIYFQNKDNFLANICLDSESLGIIRVFNIKDVKNLIKFEADCVGSEIVALGSTGILKISEKNMVYKMATARNQKFSAFTTTPDDKYLVSAGTTKDEEKGLNETTIYSYRSKGMGVLKKMDEFKIKTHWEDEGFDVLIDLACTEKQSNKYYIGGASLYTGEFFCFSIDKGEIVLVMKLGLRNPGINTFLVHYVNTCYWSSGDDSLLNRLSFTKS